MCGDKKADPQANTRRGPPGTAQSVAAIQTERSVSVTQQCHADAMSLSDAHAAKAWPVRSVEETQWDAQGQRREEQSGDYHA